MEINWLRAAAAKVSGAKNDDAGPRHAEKTQDVPAPREESPGEGWGLRSVVDHVTFIGGSDRMIAWYLAEPQTWSFRSREEGTSLIMSQASTLAELVGRRIYVRVTTRPYPISHWAAAAWGNATDPQDGFGPMMDRDQRHMAGSAQVDKLVYYGVDLGQRGRALAMLSKVARGVVDREMRTLQGQLEALDRVMAGPGVEASPVTPSEMDWLLARSFALGCPVPVPDPGSGTPRVLDAEDLAAFAASSSWSAEPLSPTVRITTSVNERQVTRHVVVLTVGRTAELQIPERHEPWMAKADALPFPVEWSATIDLRDPEEVAAEMNKLALRVDGQVSHWRDDHGKRPPKQLERQAQRIADIEDDMRSGFTGLSLRTKGWYRLAVSGATEEEALERAAAVVKLYKPAIKIERPLGQYNLAREFVPGEPLSTSAHARKWPILKAAAGLPAITAEVGDKRGFLLGETTGLFRRAVVWDPWYLTEVMETGGLVPVIGTLGSGKSVVIGYVCYKAVLSGVRGVMLDPAGRLQRMLSLPELSQISQSVNLLGGRPGSLSPYSVVPDPNPELIRLDCDDPTNAGELLARMGEAETAARSQRRELAYVTMRGMLPLAMSRDPEVQRELRRAVRATDSSINGSLNNAMAWLESHGSEGVGSEIAEELHDASERELGRLFFHEGSDRGYAFDSSARLTVFNLKGLPRPARDLPLEEYSPEELLARPLLQLATHAPLSMIYRGDPNERKLFGLDEAHEVTEQSSTGRALVTKISTDSRKNNTVALVSTQNASKVLGEHSIANYAGAVLVGRTRDDEAQRDALTLLGKPHGVGYEQLLGNLSRRQNKDERLPYREFVMLDGLGGEGGRGGMETIRIDLRHHPELFAALGSTPDGKRAVRLAGLPQETGDLEDEEVA